MSKVMRSVKNVTKGYSSVQVKVREATSNDPWGPTGTQMSEIAQLTYNSSTEFYDIVDMLDKRLNDKGKNWRHVLKALKVLDYCLHEGSELVVTWARKNVYIIKTLREFVYIDEDGRDVGQNVRVAAKELTALILDEERLRAERSDRKTWKSRVTGIEEFGSDGPAVPQQRRQRTRRPSDEEDDAEYRLAIEASKHQEEEDRRKRESRQGNEDDDDLAKAIKLSKEEEERRRRELEDANAGSLFDDNPAPSNVPQPTGINMGYQQGSNVDWLGNPIDQNQMMQQQPTGYMNNAYTGFPQNGYSNGYNNGFNPQPTGMYDPYAQQQQQNTLQPPQQQFQMQPQPTGYNPYGQQQPQFQQFQPQPTASPEPTAQPGSNNPWASNNQSQSALKPMPTGSNNPFATGFGRPQTAKAPPMPTLSSLSSLPEQKSLQSFTPSPQPQLQPQPSFNQPQQPQKQLSEHEQRLNALLASGDGMDTFGNTGDLRIPAQHTAPGTFVNSAGANANRLTAEATGSNPFLRQQYTGMPTISYGQQQMPAATGPVGMNGYGGTANPFAGRPQQQNNNQGQDLIQF
ncbi:ENTH-domain-containing protein [Annulohypoxylon maeteangense]|uniref:ENTH-domain-containing protein n=1 Tax=Annulohypoxylon maeteangense TaxID=1927788 RepID=UPI00200817AE|nr:ENTH-domain-containing protein [Annulohypoxylon maeteangense]KAI0888204.1 ENTH-domain-containing protein [Annulohypoxylon maeteangense]